MDKDTNRSDASSAPLALEGARVLVTRARAQAYELVHRLEALGAVPIEFPTVDILPPADNYAALDAALHQLATFNWGIFTSVNGVEHVWQRLAAMAIPSQAFTTMRLAAIGPSTAAALTARGFSVEVMPKRYIAEALMEALPHPAGQRFLLPRAALARDVLRTGLQAAGAEVVEVPAYQTVLATPTPSALAALHTGVDVLTFTASSTIHHFIRQVGQDTAQALINDALVVAIGPITATTARELGLRVDVVATEYTIAGLVTALVAAYQAS